MLTLLLLALLQTPKTIDIQDLLKDDQLRVTAEKNAKSNVVKFSEVRRTVTAERRAMLGQWVSGTGTVHAVNQQGFKRSKGKVTGGEINVTIEVIDGRLARHISTKASTTEDPGPVATFRKGDKISFTGLLTSFTENSIGLKDTAYKVAKP